MTLAGAIGGSVSPPALSVQGQAIRLVIDGQGKWWQELAVGGEAGNVGSSQYLTENVDLTGSAQELVSLSLAAGLWLITGEAVTGTGSAALNAVDFWLGPDSASTTGTYKSKSCENGVLAGGNENSPISLSARVVLAAAGAVYLNCQSQLADGVVLYQSAVNSLPDVTGLVAVPCG